MRYLKNIFLLLGFLGLLSGKQSFATEPYLPEIANPLSESWRWRHFPELEGKGVRCVAEDQRGTVWFGVNDGIIEYNGYDWTWHNKKNGLLGSPVEQLHADKNGIIYAITPQGLFIYKGNKWQLSFSLDENLSNTFYQTRELSNGSLMLCSRLGLFEIQGHKLVRIYTSPQNFPTLSASLKNVAWVMLPEEVLVNGTFFDISDIIEMAPGKIMASVTFPGYSKLLQFQPDKISNGQIQDYEIITSTGANPFGETQKMLRAQDSSIWIVNTSTNIGIHRLNGKRWEYFELSDLFGGDEYTTDMVQSSDGTIWVGALGKLYTYKNGKWEMYKSPEFKIPANRLLLQSKNNNIWIVGHKSKVFRLDYSSNRWITYKNLNFQCESKQKEQWFLDVKGRVINRTGAHWIAFDGKDGLMDAPVRIITTSKGQVWAAGSHQNVAATAYLENGKWHRQVHPQLSWGIDYRAVFEASDGSLWFGGGVDFFKEKGQIGGVLQLKNPTDKNLQWIHHRYHENGLLQSNAYGIGQSPDGRIWIGGGNLYYFDGQKWDRPEQSYLRQYVNIVESTDHLLMVGSRHYGIFLYDGKEWKQYDTDSGLASNTIISLHASPDGHIWAATENDISRFDGINWVNYVFPTEMNMNLEGGTITHSSDGAIWINQSSREWKRRAFSYSKMPEGMYRNFVAYRFIPDNHAPETKIELYTAEVASDGNTLVNWSGEDFLGETPDDRLLYSYRLNGGDWSRFSSEEHHTFLQLPSGRYTLEVRARDLDFNVDTSPAKAIFIVNPPVWKQAWFITLLLSFLLIIGIFEYRIITKKQKLEKLNKSLHQINGELTEKNERIELQNLEIQSQRDKLEEMVVQVEELSKSKINFFTNISHELRTPLTLILGPIEQLQNTVHAVSERERKRLLEIIERNSYRLLKLINQLLEMRRIENSTMELHLCKSNLGQFLAEITGLFDNLAREKHIHLSFQNRCDNALTAFDPDKIEKIITNLLSNAFKHTPEGGSIVVILEKSPAQQFVITVEDTGKGISPHQLPHIFERYYSAAESQHSSGIGLSYIQELIKLHDGQIFVESQEGKGTKFVVCIPANLDGTQPVEKKVIEPEDLQLTHWEVQHLHSLNGNVTHSYKSDSAANGQLPRILIVEDNEDMIDFLESILHKKYSVLKARNGNEGLQIAQNHHLDLIVSDIMMPKMNGLEFCNHIKSDFKTSHLPVILLTAKKMEEDLMEGYITGADDYMTKPFNPQLLEIRVENLLNQRAQLRTKFTRDFALQPKEVMLTSPDEELLQRLVEIMEEHIADSDFNVNKMCEMLPLSHMHFIRKVKQLTGKKPIDLLKSYRLKRAKDLLQQNKANIAEVAYMVGYDLPNSFSRAFKKEFGFSPTEYLESIGHATSVG
jgi:signal transduction histidine kinase/AraC-like DNA-binding protein/ligand-binding sensor domain-containing protein